MTNLLYRRAAELLEADLGDEMVALDPHEGNCFGFNGIATSVWRQLREPRSFEELRDTLLAEYEVDRQRCSEDLHELLDDMSAKGLIETEQL